LHNLSQEESNNIIPEGTVLLGYCGSRAHGTFIPKEDPNSIDDIDVMGISIAPLNCYFGLSNFEQKDIQYKEYDSVVYEIRKYFRLLLKGNPNVLGLMWLKPSDYIHVSDIGKQIISNRDLFVSKQAYHSFNGYAYGQLKRMSHYKFEGYMSQKRKQLVDKWGYDCKNASHLIRLLRMGIEFLTDGKLQVFREDAPELIDIKTGKWSLEKVQKESD
jgi:predicted nucleotidyltransferase